MATRFTFLHRYWRVRNSLCSSRARSVFSQSVIIWMAVAAVGLAGSCLALAQEVPHWNIPQAGGMPGLPVMTGLEPRADGVRVTWDGSPGYYRVFQRTNVHSGSWQAVTGPLLTRNATLPVGPDNAFFRVAGPAPQYAGAQACAECHEPVHRLTAHTGHAHALDTLKRIGQDKNPACLPCHTVGYGLPTGFVSETATPHLAGVQCENCHGPAANHVANELDWAARPRAELAAQVCGGCHTDSHQPTWEEWKSSRHAAVTEDLNPPGRINSCGRCHSGSVRLALVKGRDPAVAVTNDANVPITCAVCHDPHGRHVWTNVLTGTVTTNQLRHPVASTNQYAMGTGGDFTAQYNPDINLCAQCHNDHGATWSGNARAPHHSPQYNMLLGAAGVLDAGFTPRAATHALQIGNQCVGCHMPTAPYQSEDQPAMTGHSFKVESFASCRDCHVFPEFSTPFAMLSVANQIRQLKDALDLWATTRAPDTLRTQYGPRAWEYSIPGDLSPGGNGPTSAEQAQIPEAIRKARFNLYLVKYDGSYGTHNPRHTINLLEQARIWIQAELNP